MKRKMIKKSVFVLMVCALMLSSCKKKCIVTSARDMGGCVWVDYFCDIDDFHIATVAPGTIEEGDTIYRTAFGGIELMDDKP